MPEVRRLLQALAEPPARRELRLHWVHWRRAHQAAAQRCHVARRARRHPPPAPPVPVVVAVPETPPLTDGGWAELAPLFAPRERGGRPPRDHHRLLDSMLWVMHTGAPWREVPARFGPWETAYSRYRRWCRDGTWDRILAVLQPSQASRSG